MISKVARVTSSSAFNIKSLNDYLRTGHKNEPQPEKERVRSFFTLNMYAQDLDTACQEMMYTASLNTRSKCSKYMHLVLSLSEGEKLEEQRWKDVANDYLKKVQMSGHQVIAVRHNDNGKEHLHLIINRIDTEKHTRVNDYKLYRKLQKFDEEIERKYHLKEFDHKASERQDYQQSALRHAQEIEKKTEHQTFLSYLMEHKAEILKADSWQQLQQKLAEFDCQIAVKGRGLVIKSLNPDHPAEAKASSFDRNFSYARLVKKWGLPPDLNLEDADKKREEKEKKKEEQERLRRQQVKFSFEEKPLTRKAQWMEYSAYFFKKIEQRHDQVVDLGNRLLVKKANSYQTIQDLLKIARHRFGDGHIVVHGDRNFQRRTMYHALKLGIKIKLTDETVKMAYEQELRKREFKVRQAVQRNQEIQRRKQQEQEYERQVRRTKQHTEFVRNQKQKKRIRNLDLSR